MLFGFLRKENESEYKSETIRELEALLHLHTLDSIDLIHEYFLERLHEQNEMEEATEGMLTVKLVFINDVLKVDVLNASAIKAMDSNGISQKLNMIYLQALAQFRGGRCLKYFVLVF